MKKTDRGEDVASKVRENSQKDLNRRDFLKFGIAGAAIAGSSMVDYGAAIGEESVEQPIRLRAANYTDR